MTPIKMLKYKYYTLKFCNFVAMKPFGAAFEYERERNRELLLAFRSLLAQAKRVNTKEIFKQLVEMPCSRFWVSPERATQVVYRLQRGDALNDKSYATKKAMFMEIFQRTMRIKKREPSRQIPDIVSEVVCQRAPRFYLTPESARVILIQAKKQWKEEQQKQQHSR